jgi:hypothetical protein
MVKRGYSRHSVLMGQEFPIVHDNMIKPKGFPPYYCLNDGWQIEKQSLPYIVDGPLFSEENGELLVAPKLLFASFRKYIWPCIANIVILYCFFEVILLIFGLAYNN